MNKKIIIEGLDGVGKSTLVEALSKKLNCISRKFPTDDVIDINNKTITSISNLLYEAESLIKSEWTNPLIETNMYKYYKLAHVYRCISEKYLEFTYNMIADQSKDYKLINDQINDRGLVTTFIYNYMEYIFFDLIYQKLFSFDIFQKAYIDHRCGIFNTNTMRKILKKVTDDIIKTTIPSNMKQYWEDFITILNERSKMPNNINPNIENIVIILHLENNFRMDFLKNEKINDIKYKEFLEQEDKQNRYNSYLNAFKTSNAYKINNKYINSIHFIDSGYYDRTGSIKEDKYKRLPTDAVVNMILRELKMEELI